MLCFKQCYYLRSNKIDLLQMSLRRCISFYSNKSAVKPSIYFVVQRPSFHNERNYSSFVNKCLINNNLNCLKKDQRRNFSFESIVQTQMDWYRCLSESTVVEYTQNFIMMIHDSTGLPWWMTIILTTCFFRTFITVPLALYQNYILARLANLSSEMAAILEELKLETAVAIRKFDWSESQTKIVFSRSAKKQWRKLIERDNCHPVKASLLIWFQIPMWFVISTALRNIVYMMPYSDAAAQIRFLELSVGGCLWLPNLTVPDTIILPLTLGLVNLAIIEIHSLMRVGEKTRLQRYFTNFFRGFSIVMIPIAANVPSCLALYWVSSSVFGLCQNLMLMSPRIKQLVGIPKTKNDISKPYTHLMTQIKNKFRF